MTCRLSAPMPTFCDSTRKTLTRVTLTPITVVHADAPARGRRAGAHEHDGEGTFERRRAQVRRL